MADWRLTNEREHTPVYLCIGCGIMTASFIKINMSKANISKIIIFVQSYKFYRKILPQLYPHILYKLNIENKFKICTDIMIIFS